MRPEPMYPFARRIKSLFRLSAAAALLVSAAPAQSDHGATPVGSSLREKRAAYQTAYHDLITADPNLEKELRTAPKDVLLDRITKQQRRVEQFTNSRLELYNTMRTGLGQHLQNLQAGTKVDPAVFHKSIEDGLAALKQEQDMVEKDLQTNKDPALNAALAKQKDILQKLEFNLLKEERDIGIVTSSGAEAEAAMQQARQTMQSLATELNDAEQRTRNIGAQWNSYYAKLKSSVENRKDAPANPLVGSWGLGQAFPPPPMVIKSFQVKIAAAGGQLHGTLSVDCLPPANSKVPPHVEAPFLADLSSHGPFPFVISNTLAGTINITPQGKQIQVSVYINGEEQFTGFLVRVGP